MIKIKKGIICLVLLVAFMAEGGKNTVIFAASPMVAEQEVSSGNSNKTSAVQTVTAVSVAGITVGGGEEFNTKVFCTTTGIATPSAITYTTEGPNGDVEVSGIVEWNKKYKAKVILATDEGYEFDSFVSVTVDGVELSNPVEPNSDGTLTVTKEFTTNKRVIASVTAPTVPERFTTYYGYEGYAASPISGSSIELGTQATVKFKETVEPTEANMDVIWTIESAGGVYDNTPGAKNTFRWTIPKSALTNYNASGCQGYDDTTDTITGTVEITNKGATSVTITGDDKGIVYTGATIDVSQYFNIDPNAGTATYSLVTGTDGGTGKGSLNDAKLTVTKNGTFKIKVETKANGIYAAGDATITLTVSNGTIEYTATDYSGTYDGQTHSISVNVSNPEGTTITYSTDGENYDSAKPSFRDEGTYIVYYRITKDNYTTIEDSGTVTINKKSATITAGKQNIAWGNEIDQGKYTVDGLATGDSITAIILTPSTTALTENGTISISGVKIKNAAGEDVTGNYDMTLKNGTVKITHNTMLAPDRIELVKVKTTYSAGDTINVDDITVTAYYEDGYSEAVTDFTTNADGIDMQVAGTKTLTVSYTKNGGTKTKDINIKVSSLDTEGNTYAEESPTKAPDPLKKAIVEATWKESLSIKDQLSVKIFGEKVNMKSISIEKKYKSYITFSEKTGRFKVKKYFKNAKLSFKVNGVKYTTKLSITPPKPKLKITIRGRKTIVAKYSNVKGASKMVLQFYSTKQKRYVSPAFFAKNFKKVKGGKFTNPTPLKKIKYRVYAVYGTTKSAYSNVVTK